MAIDKFNRLLALFFVFVGLAGSVPSFYPIAMALQALIDPFEWQPRLAAVGALIGLGAGYALLLGYCKYFAGREKRPVRLWTLSLGYNLLLTALCFGVGVMAGDGIVLLTLWPLLLTVLSAIAVGRERELHEGFGGARVSRA